MTERQAFEAMIVFLTRYAVETQSEQVEELLLSLSHPRVQEGQTPITSAPGYWEDWTRAVSESLAADEFR